LVLCAISTSGFAQHQSSKAGQKPATQIKSSFTELLLEETPHAMTLGSDGMVYLLYNVGGRYNKGSLYKLDPQAFSRLLRDKNGRYHAAPDDLIEIYVFGQRDEKGESTDNPDSIIAGADGKLYISGHWHNTCARYDPAKGSVEWIKYGPGNLPYGDSNHDLQDPWALCFAATADGMLWCRLGGEGSAGKVFHTRGEGKDLGGILGTEQWKYAALGGDGYLYGATDDALIRVRTDGSDITVLHAFTGKNDRPVGAPILVGNTLFGYAHDEPKSGSGHARSGYIYKLNSDGTGYSTLVNLDYGPDKWPLIAYDNTLYGMAPAGLYMLSVNQPTPKIIAPTKENLNCVGMVILSGAAYILPRRNQLDPLVFRIPIAETAPAATASSPAGRTDTGPGPPDAADATGAGTASSAPATSAAPVPGGKNVFHKREGQPGADAGLINQPAPAATFRPGDQTARGSAPSSAAGSADAGASSPVPETSAAPAPGGKSVFHKRDNAGSTGAPSSRQGAAEQQPSSVSGFSSDNARQTAGARPAGGGTPGSTKKTKFPSNQTNDSGPLSGDTAEDANQTDAGAYEEATGGSASSFGGLGSNRTNSNAGPSAGGASDTSAIAGMVVEAYSNGDLATFASLYADTVDYMGHRQTSNADVQRQLSQYFAKWPVRQWQLVGAVRVVPVGPSAQRVAFSAQYDVSNPNTNRHAAGIANETLIVKDDGTGAMKITLHQEKVNSNGDSDTATEKKRRRPNRERVYDGRPVIPLPRNIPWPPGLPHP
jgi:hypothetical protein